VGVKGMYIAEIARYMRMSKECCEESWDGLRTFSLLIYLHTLFLSIPSCSAIAVTLIPFSFISLIIIHTSSLYTIPHLPSQDGGEFLTAENGEK